MSTTTLLNKFAAVEIDNSSRITEAERIFCAEQQELYEAVLNQQQKSFEAHAAIRNQDYEFLQSVADKNQYGSTSYERHYSWEFFELSKDRFAEKIRDTVHKRFITQIMNYFKKNYGVDMEDPTFELLTGLTMPEHDSDIYFAKPFSRLSDEEKEAITRKREAYDRQLDEYYDSVIKTPLNWSDIVDHIFVQLGGCSFEERAEQEIIDNCKDALWRRYGGSRYEVKNKRIAFNILYPSKGWDDQMKVRLDDLGYLALLRALTYFDTNKATTDVCLVWKHRFVDYEKKDSDGIFDSHVVGDAEYDKVLTFKYYKNGKFEVGFVSAAAAQEFADTYCKHEEEAEAV